MTDLPLQEATQLTAQLIGLAILAGTLAAIVAALYRWSTRETVPRGLALLVGLSGIAIYLNTTTALGQAIGGDVATIQELQVALFHIVAFLVGAGGSLVGRSAGDQFGNDVLLKGTTHAVDEEVSRLVQSVGRVISVQLPQDIDDVVGYDPVASTTKEELAGKRFVFPRNLTVEELEARIVARLKSDYGVGHVDIEVAGDGTIEYLAVGSRAAGIGPTLPPATNAVAVRADPAFAASTGDLVQIWETDPLRRVLTGELLGIANDVVTVAIDAADTPKVDPRRQYKLVTLPVNDRPGREFASLLRAAEETFESVTVEAGSPLHGMPIGALDVTVIAITPTAGEHIALPDDSYVLGPGEQVFTIARPEVIRRLEMASTPIDPSLLQTPASPPQEAEPAPPTDETEHSTEQDLAQSDTTDQVIEADTTGPASQQPNGDTIAETEASEGDTSPGESKIKGKADERTFERLKAEYEATDSQSDDSTGGDDAPADEGSSSEADQLPDEDEPAIEAQEESPAATDDGFDDATISFDESETASELGPLGEATTEQVDDEDTQTVDPKDDELTDLAFETDEDDDLSDLSFDDDEPLDFDEEADDDNPGDDTGETDESEGASSTFQQLKEEFESGEADWEDDIADSPGGDMRLDE